MRAALDDLLGQGAVEHARDRPLARAPEDDRGGAAAGGIVEQGVDDVGAVQDRGVAAEASGDGEGAIEFDLGIVVGHAAAANGDGSPWRVAAFGQAPGHTHEILRLAVAVHGDDHASAQRHAGKPARGLRLAQVAVDAIGRGLHRQFAEGGEVRRREIRLQRLRGLLGHVDLALMQALDQLARRQVDQDHVAKAIEHRIGHGFADPDSGDAMDDVVEALEMLDIDRRVDVDTRFEQLGHVLPTPLVAAARRVAVRELIDQGQCRPARQQGIEVHFLEGAAAVGDLRARDDFEAFEQGRSFAAAVRFDDADDHVDATALELACAVQHRVGLADAGGGAEEDRELAGALALKLADQGIGLFAAGVVHGEDYPRSGSIRGA